MLLFLLQVIGISLSGVMAPGPMTAATLAAGLRNRNAGLWLAIGHGIVEFPLMVLIVTGASVLMSAQWFQIGIGLVGGVVLVVLAVLSVAALRRRQTATTAVPARRPIWTGIMLTGANPYFLLWWATIGLSLATRAVGLGVLAFALFAVVHWLCDLAWMEVLSHASYKGVQIAGPRMQAVLGVLCAGAMACFGVWFFWDAVHRLAA